MINIHPALLPSFKGLDTHARALDAGVRIHGCTVHFVTPEMDDGPIIAQAAVPVLIGDSEDDLTARVLKAEHRLYPLALGLVAEGKARMEGGRTVFSGFADDIDRGCSPACTAPSPLDEGPVDLERTGAHHAVSAVRRRAAPAPRPCCRGRRRRHRARARRRRSAR